MKKAGMTLFVIVTVVATLHAFRAIEQANIRGKVMEQKEVVKQDSSKMFFKTRSHTGP